MFESELYYKIMNTENEIIKKKFLQRRFFECIDLCNNAIQENSNNAFAYYYRALIYDEQKKTELAIKDYLNVVKNTKELPIVNYMLGVDYDSIEKYKEAYKYYNEFISSYTTDDEYLKYAKTRAEELKPYANPS